MEFDAGRPCPEDNQAARAQEDNPSPERLILAGGIQRRLGDLRRKIALVWKINHKEWARDPTWV
jgi:hypothetical protein